MLQQAREQFADHGSSWLKVFVPPSKEEIRWGFAYFYCGCNMNIKPGSRGVECRAKWLGEQLFITTIFANPCTSTAYFVKWYTKLACMLILIYPGFSRERVHFFLSSWYTACSVLHSLWSWNHNIISFLSFHSYDFTCSNNLLPLAKMGIRHLCEN